MGNQSRKTPKDSQVSIKTQSCKPNEMRENEINLIAHNTGFSRQKVLEWHTKFQNDYPSGYITKPEFICSFKSLYTFGRADKIANFAFNLFDKDHDDTISFREFLISTAFLTYNNMLSHKKKSLELAFLIFDTDNNEKIDRKEIQKVFDAVYSQHKGGSSQARLEINKIFDKYDFDKSDTLDKNEFINALFEEKIFDILINEN